jgi:hypothetical protein
MKQLIRPPIVLAAALAVVALAITAGVFAAENIDPNADNSQFAWSENEGWLNAEPGGDGGPGMKVGQSTILGFLWSENMGWINLSCKNNNTCATTNYGVTRSGSALAGYAWSENKGWISFSCTNTASCGTVSYGVTINGSNELAGYAWGENIGWISMNCDNTATCATVDYDVQICPDNDITSPFGPTVDDWIVDGVGPEGLPGGCDAADADDDNDNCDDSFEPGLSPARSATNPWDFYDVPAPPLPDGGAARDEAVSLVDVASILQWFGAVNDDAPNGSGRDYDDNNNANGIEDGAEYDRSSAGLSISGPPDGAVSLIDAAVAIEQFGDACV